MSCFILMDCQEWMGKYTSARKLDRWWSPAFFILSTPQGHGLRGIDDVSIAWITGQGFSCSATDIGQMTK
jgi:hypothetical protein